MRADLAKIVYIYYSSLFATTLLSAAKPVLYFEQISRQLQQTLWTEVLISLVY